MQMQATKTTTPAASRPRQLAPQRVLPLSAWEKLGTVLVNVLVMGLLVVYLFPMVYMVATSLMDSRQLGDRYAPPYPAVPVTYAYGGENLRIYKVPFEDGVRELALVNKGRQSSEFIDPKNPEAGLVAWQGSWRALPGVYRFQATLENFELLFRSVRFPELIGNTLLAAAISTIAVLASSLVVAYGFARYPLPGGNLLFYVLIGTMLIPDKVTLIPTYFFYVRVLAWNGSWLPILLPFFFGSALYIFLLRQNFRSIPKEVEEAAMLDGAGPVRTLVSVVIPQSWPVIITVALLHFFYIWNETRQAALYLSTRRDLAPVSFGIQNFQSLSPTQNLLQASALIILLVPIIVLLLSQRHFMRNLVITGMER
jgi:multiple sugar transport system permease protein